MKHDEKKIEEILMKNNFFRTGSSHSIDGEASMKQYAEHMIQQRDIDLENWITNDIGVSSKAIYSYMVKGEIPNPFDCPHDKWDRARCVSLLKARPEWVSRLQEIINLDIEGISNGKKVFPWNEQMPLIINLINKEYESK